MQILRDNLWLCVDCSIVAVNGDYSSFDYHYSDETERNAKIAKVNAGLERLGRHLVPNFDSETGEGHDTFSTHTCDCCGGYWAGEWHRFAILGPEDERITRDAPFKESVSCRYGAPMGRRSDPVSVFTGRKVKLQRVRFVSYDYDQGGAYWGGYECEPLWCAWDNEHTVYVRAPNREQAKAKLTGVRFYR